MKSADKDRKESLRREGSLFLHETAAWVDERAQDHGTKEQKTLTLKQLKTGASSVRLETTKSKGDATVKKDRIHKFLTRLYRCRMLYLMILPSLAAVFIFHYIPIYGVQIAFKDFRSSLGIWESPWVGMKHFENFFRYPYFGRILWNTVRISLVSLCTFPCSILFALMLNEMRNERLKKVLQQFTYAPHFVSTVVVCSMTILFLSRGGLIDMLAGIFGARETNLMTEPAAFAGIYAVTGLWQGLGWGTIIYLATLSGVSQELIEAAKIDGATRLQIIRHVDLPHLKPTIITLFILQMGSLLSVGFEKVLLLQNPLNLEASSVISTYTYEVGILNQQLSYSAAIGLFNNIVNILFIVTANAACRKVSKVGLW